MKWLRGPATAIAVMASDAVSGMIVGMFREKSKMSCKIVRLLYGSTVR